MKNIALTPRWTEGRSAAVPVTVPLVLPLAWCRATACGLIVTVAMFWVWLRTTTPSASRSQRVGSCHTAWSRNCRSVCTRSDSWALTTRYKLFLALGFSLWCSDVKAKVFISDLHRWWKSSKWRVWRAAWTPCSTCWRRPVDCSNWCGESLCQMVTQWGTAATTSRSTCTNTCCTPNLDNPINYLQKPNLKSFYPPYQGELLKNEIARLKNRLSQQERMLSGAVKRLRTTNQLKEGMERVIIDQCKFISFTRIVYNIADITNTICILLFFFSHNLRLNYKSYNRRFPLFWIPVCK